MEQIYLVELTTVKENEIYDLQEILLDKWCVHAKNQDRSPSKISS